MIISSGADNALCRTAVDVIALPQSANVQSVNYSPSERRVAAFCLDASLLAGRLRVLQPESGAFDRRTPGAASTGHQLTCHVIECTSLERCHVMPVRIISSG